MPIGWMWSLGCDLVRIDRQRPENRSHESAFTASSTHSVEVNNDSYGLSRLSKIAHLARLELQKATLASGFTHLPLAGGMGKFRGHLAIPVKSARWRGPERWSNRRLRSKY